jgi:hypothetical protein
MAPALLKGAGAILTCDFRFALGPAASSRGTGRRLDVDCRKIDQAFEPPLFGHEEPCPAEPYRLGVEIHGTLRQFGAVQAGMIGEHSG